MVKSEGHLTFILMERKMKRKRVRSERTPRTEEAQGW